MVLLPTIPKKQTLHHMIKLSDADNTGLKKLIAIKSKAYVSTCRKKGPWAKDCAVIRFCGSMPRWAKEGDQI